MYYIIHYKSCVTDFAVSPVVGEQIFVVLAACYHKTALETVMNCAC